MLGAGPGIAYIHEPFNILHNRGLCSADFKHWFTYVSGHNAASYEASLRDTLRMRFNLQARLQGVSDIRAIARGFAQAGSLALKRLRSERPLLKDPIAVFSAEWLAATFDMDVVIIIRHPAAVAESLKAQGWVHPFSHFVEQPELMRVLASFAREICHFAEEEQSILDQAALLWKLIYHVVDGYRKSHPEWLFVRHEDLLEAPVTEFKRMYEQLGIRFTKTAQSTIEAFSARESPVGARPGSILPRNNRDLSRKWKRRLRPDEIARLKSRVWEVSQHFYSEDDWR